MAKKHTVKMFYKLWKHLAATLAPWAGECGSFPLISFLWFTGKNNGFPFLDILGYLKNTNKNPKFARAKWDKSQPGNSQPSSQIGTCLTLPNLGFLWVFFKYPKISKNGNLLFFPVVDKPIPNLRVKNQELAFL